MMDFNFDIVKRLVLSLCLYVLCLAVFFILLIVVGIQIFEYTVPVIYDWFQ